MNGISRYEYAVKAIKQAVEKSRYRAAKAGNAELLSLYYGIGEYVSENTRNGTWGTDAIKTISDRLKSELAGVRGFSETNIKNMRIFYEEWKSYVNRQPIADDLEVNEERFLLAIRQPLAGEINGMNLYPWDLHIIWKFCPKPRVLRRGYFIFMNVLRGHGTNTP